jgi:hypothetical protein
MLRRPSSLQRKQCGCSAAERSPFPGEVRGRVNIEGPSHSQNVLTICFIATRLDRPDFLVAIACSSVYASLLPCLPPAEADGFQSVSSGPLVPLEFHPRVVAFDREQRLRSVEATHQPGRLR